MTEPTETELAARYGARLQAEAVALRAASDATAAGRRPVELDQNAIGRLSRQDALLGQAMASAMEARRHGRLRAIAAAQARMEDGAFGWCEDCGDFIGFARLDVDPCVMRCVSCAS